ncbi:UNVERIFIED_ORG: hypothetical protein ABRZ91_003125 [Heyndrickxia coagulans]
MYLIESYVPGLLLLENYVFSLFEGVTLRYSIKTQ